MTREKFEDCIYCNGTGRLPESNCCGGRLLGNAPDHICGFCKDHCEAATCEECEGLGYIELVSEPPCPETWAEYNGDA